jgi:hypothetical protein
MDQVNNRLSRLYEAQPSWRAFNSPHLAAANRFGPMDG